MAKKVVLKITGMHCTSCAMNIDGDLEDNVKGVKSAKTSYAKLETEVEFEEEVVQIEQIIKQIKETGYQAEIQA
ncbi:MAG TPA: cation transporter [Candidatus Sulfotelmatobacter sp.]|jgi:Cu+-exporting ATPase|nr:cation transporter [Candidatus Sulfotelmatobacter sp.]